ncbi:fructoselysine 6-kinase [Ensifer adhaerens]|uniref:PfkB family carbohydrate kinase n=1 Tax=Ensifer adhaerens TaxID=106592 RepID=UPI001CBB125E|nr:PfkB family carbohydrate kinase [Ensifer adhaerens]MBZ7925448.1 PfkB family carbohydrate kinase [Ensifer adhaerens]UAX95392.1 fructoselysine 6-kinase [Ensifer adhaerens]UAY02716.1 fructoselysine 6-kinase [Ensifer adhaerens]UAY10700.1 fructoselysine 6-kinase [Ensifer adhaerens]
MTTFRLAAVGDNCIDRFQAPVSEAYVGGNAINVAVQWALLGHQSHYFGAVGGDRDGAQVRQLLEQNGVRLAGLKERDVNTAYTDIGITPEGERVFLYENFGACAGYRPDAGDLALLKTMDHVHIGWLDDGGALRRALATAGVSVSQDMSVNAAPANLGVEGLSIAFGSGSDGDQDAERLAGDFLARGAGLAVVTRGALGSLASNGAELVSTGSRPVDVVDTTGAGDSFIAGFILAQLQGRPLVERLEAGRDLAARTCTHVGGFPQQPHAL